MLLLDSLQLKQSGESLFCTTHKGRILSFVKSRVLVFFDEFTAGDMLITSSVAEFCYVSEDFIDTRSLSAAKRLIRSRIIPDRSEPYLVQRINKEMPPGLWGLNKRRGNDAANETTPQ